MEEPIYEDHGQKKVWVYDYRTTFITLKKNPLKLK
jgi:hypothetical protein